MRVRPNLVEDTVPVFLVGVATDGVGDNDVQISEDALGLTPLGVGSTTATLCSGSATLVRFSLVEDEVPLLAEEGEEEVDEQLLNVGVDAADGVDDDDVQISEDTLCFTPIGVS